MNELVNIFCSGSLFKDLNNVNFSVVCYLSSCATWAFKRGHVCTLVVGHGVQTVADREQYLIKIIISQIIRLSEYTTPENSRCHNTVSRPVEMLTHMVAFLDKAEHRSSQRD